MTIEDNKLHGINPVLGTDNEDRKLDIVFIHGLGGHAKSTWFNENEVFWPSWLVEDISDVAVWSIGYDATPTAWLGDTMSMEERAINMLSDLSTKNDIGTRPLFFIVHSMGGLILKFMIEKSSGDKDYSSIVEQTKGIVFLATPHEGSYGATFLSNLTLIFRVNDIVKQLGRHASSLNRLDEAFTTIVRDENLNCFSFYETKEIRIKQKVFGIPFISKGIKVVGKSSAKGRFNQPTPLPVDRDHLDICKFQSKDDMEYRKIKTLIEEALDEVSTVNNIDQDYLDIESALSEPNKNKTSSTINKIFLIFKEDDISNIKYEVTGYIQTNDDFESELIEYTFENIYDENEQEAFLDRVIKESELDNVPIHFILPPSLFLVNFKQWKYKGSEFVKLYHVLLHNKEKFMRKIGKYKHMVENWNSLFEQLKDTPISEALSIIHNKKERFDVRDKKIGVCFKYSLESHEALQDILFATNIGLWQYQTGIMSDYQTWVESSICLNHLNKHSRECDHVALLWDDMNLLEELKRRI